MTPSMMYMATTEQKILEQGLWFQALPAALKQQLLEMAQMKKLVHGEALFLRGDARCGLYAVLSGMVRISGLNEEGKEAILTFVEAPNWFGEVALFDGEKRTHDAMAEGSVTLLHFPQSALDRLLDAEPGYWREFGLLLARKLRLAFTAIEDLALLPASVRLSRRLVMMAEGDGGRICDGKHIVSVPQEQLGKMLSMSRQTANQILKDLASQGLIRIAYGHIEICALEELKRLSGYQR